MIAEQRSSEERLRIRLREKQQRIFDQLKDLNLGRCHAPVRTCKYKRTLRISAEEIEELTIIHALAHLPDIVEEDAHIRAFFDDLLHFCKREAVSPAGIIPEIDRGRNRPACFNLFRAQISGSDADGMAQRSA